MTQTLRQRRELRDVSRIGKTVPKLLTEGAPYIPAHDHYGSQGLAQFTARMVERGMKVRPK